MPTPKPDGLQRQAPKEVRTEDTPSNPFDDLDDEMFDDLLMLAEDAAAAGELGEIDDLIQGDRPTTEPPPPPEPKPPPSPITKPPAEKAVEPPKVGPKSPAPGQAPRQPERKPPPPPDAQTVATMAMAAAEECAVLAEQSGDPGAAEQAQACQQAVEAAVRAADAGDEAAATAAARRADEALAAVKAAAGQGAVPMPPKGPGVAPGGPGGPPGGPAKAPPRSPLATWAKRSRGY